MKGEAGIGPVSADIDLSFGDILEDLEIGFMGIYRGTRGPWSISVDGIYTGLGANSTGPNGLATADVDVDQSAIEVDVGDALSENFSLLVGAQLRVPLPQNWSFNLRGDVGGLDAGSSFAWQGLASLRWQATPRFGLIVAYRQIEMDYEDGSGDGAFVYDLAMSGPALGFAFTF